MTGKSRAAAVLALILPRRTSQATKWNDNAQTAEHCLPSTSYCLLFSLTAEAVFSAVEEALDVRLVLHDDEHSDNHGENHLAEVDAFEVVFRAEVAEHRKCAEQTATKDATDRHVFRRDREENPESECAKDCERRNSEEHAKSSEHALTTAETGKASKAVAENHEETRD